MFKATITLLVFTLAFEISCGQQVKNSTFFKEQAIEHYLKKSYRKADSTFRKCVNAAKKEKKWRTVGQCYNNLASVQFQLGEYAKGIVNYENAVNTYLENDMDTLLGESYLNLGLAYKKQSVYDSAFVNFYKGISILEKLGEKKSLIKGYNRLANSLRETVSLGKAKKYYLKALELAKQEKSRADIANLYNNLGVLFNKQNQYDSAIFSFKKSLTYKSDKQYKGLGNTYYNLGETFNQLNLIDSARIFYKKSHKNRVLAKDKFGLAHSKIALAEISLKQGKPDIARMYLSNSDTLVSSLDSYDLSLKLKSAKRDFAIFKGAFAEAENLRRDMHQLRETILNKDRQSLITSYEVQYDVRKLKESITKKDQALIWLFTVAFLLLIIGILLFREQRKKREDARKIETLFLDMHHRIKNNLSLLSGVITHKKRTTAEPSGKRTLKEIGGQIDAINLIHKKLYRKKGMGIAQLDISDYLQELVGNIFVSAGLSKENYKLDFKLDQTIIAADKGNPIGLIVNEVITNMIKYGVSEDGKWYCSVTLEQRDFITITISDKGKGISNEGADQKNDGGRQLIKILASQIGAVSSYEISEGAVFTLRFEK